MSTTIYAKQNPSPVVTRRAPLSNEDTVNGSQRTTNRRSLSDRLRNLFRRNSSSPNRTASSVGRTPPPTSSSVRQGSASPTPGKSSTDAPHLRAPTLNWPFGKKKTKLSTAGSTPTASKKKIKSSKKTNQAPVPIMEISSPIYQQEYQTSINGQHFAPRTPEYDYGSTGRLQSSSTYEVTTAKGFRDYVVVEQTQRSQQLVVPDPNVFTPPTYTSDHSRSPSMNRQRLPNTNNEYYFHHDNATPTVSIPLADIEVIHTPPSKRKVADYPPSNNTKSLAEKPPKSPQTSSRPPSATQPSSIITNPTQWKNTSSSTLNTTGVRSARSPTKDVDVPKLHAPLINFGSSSTKKKSRQTKSQSPADGMRSSSSTINTWAQQNPINPDRSWAKTYGSLPDAEIIHGGSLTSLNSSKSKSKSKSKANRYPGISAIVQHHLLLPPVYYNERPPIKTTTTRTTRTASPQSPRRFDTSTTTLNEYEENQLRPQPINNGSAPSISSLQRHDGYIRPMTPQKPSVQPDVGVIRVDIDDLRGRSPRTSRYNSPDPPQTYRSSATIYTRDKNRCIDGGQIRTWSSHENNVNDDYDSYRKPPYAHVQVDIKYGPQTNGYDHQIVSPKVKDNYDEYRYSPRAHEQQLYEKEQKRINDQEVLEEERYEISYEYERQHQQYLNETRKQYDELVHSTNRYSNDIHGDQNVTYSTLSSTGRSEMRNERDKTYDQSSRSYIDSERIQEPFNTVAPVHHSEEIPRNYTLRRSDSYDGIGISIGANSQTRSNHFIRDVELGSPGHQAGLRKNDRIIGVNGIDVENVDFSNVLILIKQGLENDNLQLSVIHGPEHN